MAGSNMLQLMRTLTVFGQRSAGSGQRQCKSWERGVLFKGFRSDGRDFTSETGTSVTGEERTEKEEEKSPTGLTASNVMTLPSNRTTRFVYLRTLPLARQTEFSGREEEFGRQIEHAAKGVVSRHLSKIVDDRAAVHVHTAALAVATKKTLGPFLGNKITLENMVRAGFGAPLIPDETTMSDEELLVLNDDQKVRPDYWVVRFALWLAFDKMAAIRRMTQNMVKDFGKAFTTSSISDEIVGELLVPNCNQRPKCQLARLCIICTDKDKCLYNDVCRQEGDAELTKVFCALDRNIYAPINGTRRRIQFTLNRTLADDAKQTGSLPRKEQGDGSINSSPTGPAVEDKEEQVEKEEAACEFRFVKGK